VAEENCHPSLGNAPFDELRLQALGEDRMPEILPGPGPRRLDTMPGMENRWITGRLTAGAPHVRLICLPQAGGGVGAFSSWRAHLPDGVELAPVELPGRGTREADPMPARFDDLVDALYKGLLPELDVPYVLFGRSFGGALAYELTLRIEERGAPAPFATLVSASRAPQTPPTGTSRTPPTRSCGVAGEQRRAAQ
jgi:hypothetical protein